MSEPVPCNYCGVDDATVVFGPGVAQDSQIVQCNRCGLMYVNPRVKAVDHVKIGSWDPDWDPVGQSFWTRRLSKEQVQVRDYARTKALLNQLYPQRGKLLELGCSLGFLLAEFKKDGWDVLGVEPDGFSSRYARKTQGIEVVNSILEDAGLADESFDVVLLNHVIEHVPNPIETFRQINRVMKMNGHFVVETPRFDSLMFKFLGRRERNLILDGHIYFFTSQTLRKLYELAGFQHVRLDYVGRTLSADRLLWRIGEMSKAEWAKRRLDQISRGLGLEKVRIHLNMRDIQRACIRKLENVSSTH